MRGRLFRNRARCDLAVRAGGAGARVLFAAFLTPYDPNAGEVVERLLPIGLSRPPAGDGRPGARYARPLLYGGQLSLLAGFAPVLIANRDWTALVRFAGYVGGAVRSVLMRSLDMFYALRPICWRSRSARHFGPGLLNVIISVSIVFVAPIARVAESATRWTMADEYIEAAHLSGAGTASILFTELLPNIFNPIFVYTSGLVGLSMILASSLGFSASGSSPPTPEWGYMLNALRPTIYVNPWVVVLPGVMIFITSIAFNTLSDAIRDSMDIKTT